MNQEIESNYHAIFERTFNLSDHQNELQNKQASFTTEKQEDTSANNEVSLSQARAIAESKFPHKQIVSFEKESGSDQKVYSFQFTDDSKVDIDLFGEVSRVENNNNGS